MVLKVLVFFDYDIIVMRPGDNWKKGVRPSNTLKTMQNHNPL